jgi:pectinesterase
MVHAQYKNGGWPIYYPLRKGCYTHITINNNSTGGN